jgi:hypothetical protein
MALIERAIASAFVNDNLHIHLLRGQQGSHTLTFALRLYQPTKANLAKALKLASAVEAAIGDSPVRIYSERGIIFVETPSPSPVQIAGNSLRGAALAVPLGMTARRTIAGVDFSTNPHLLLVGPTNAGKTTAARALAYHCDSTMIAPASQSTTCNFSGSSIKLLPEKGMVFTGERCCVIIRANKKEEVFPHGQ